MPFKAANKSKTLTSAPAKGTLVTNSKFAGAALGVATKKSTDKSESFDRNENAGPTEIISLVDFNRVYERSGTAGPNLTPYGQYFKALQSIHSITTEDVTYVISKSLENDTTGAWNSLKSNVDISVEDAQDFITDLSDLLNKIEQAERSLDITRSDDPMMRSESIEYLGSKVKRYQKNPDSRVYNVSEIYPSLTASGASGSIFLKALISTMRNRITMEEDPNVAFIVSSLAAPNDLNSKNVGTFWYDLEKSGDNSSKLLTCANALSQILSLSSGIPRVNNDAISGRISFDPKNLDSVFNGMSPAARPGKTTQADRIPFARKIERDIGPNFVTLSMLQKNADDGKVIIPVEMEDDPKGKYQSGVTKMIREALQRGDYTFTELNSFCDQFEQSRKDLETYVELLVGQCDPNNKLTPDEVLRTIISYFIKALEVCEYSKIAGYELITIKKSNKDASLKQALLQSAGRTKYFQLTANVSTNTSGEDSGYDTSLSTSKVSNNSESLKDDATATTTQIENKSPKRPVRVIERIASDSPTSSDIRDTVYSKLLRYAKDGPPTKQEIQNKINKLNKKLEDYELERNIAIASAAALAAGGVAGAVLTFGVAGAAAGAAAAAAVATIVYYEDKVRETKAKISNAKAAMENAPAYDNKDTLKQRLYDMTLTPNSTVVSCIVEAYNDLVRAAVSRTPESQSITNIDGTTRYGRMDEFGMLSLIVQMFGAIADQMDITISKDGAGNMLLDGLDGASLRSFKVDLKSLIPENEEYVFEASTCDEAPDVKSAMNLLCQNTQIYQNVQAILSAYSTTLTSAKDDLTAEVSDLLATPDRRARLDNEKGRKLMSSLTSQQVIYRRSLLDKYLPNANAGYLPARICYSPDEDLALEDLLSSEEYANLSSENVRIAFVAIPIGTLNENVKYKNKDLGEQNFSGFMELMVHKKDQEFDDIVFESMTYIFDPQLFVAPGSFDFTQNVRNVSDSDSILRVAKKCSYKLYDRNGSESLSYNELLTHSRYSAINKKTLDQIIRNTVASYLLESYVFKTAGMIFDESVSLDLNDGVSQTAITALSSVSSLNLPDLKLPSADQITSVLQIDGVNFNFDDGILTTGDKELLSALSDSYLMKSENPIDRLIETPSFDRVVAIAFDPDKFNIDVAKTKRESGTVGSAMLGMMEKMQLLDKDSSILKIKPRDPLAGGFSVGSFTCQFVPHTTNSDGSSIVESFEEKINKQANKSVQNPVKINSKSLSSLGATGGKLSQLKKIGR
jgi:hypothetical protein